MDVLIYFNESENEAIVMQEGDIPNDDPRSFCSSLKTFLSDWLVDDVPLIELVANDSENKLSTTTNHILAMKESGLTEEQAIERLVNAIHFVYHINSEE